MRPPSPALERRTRDLLASDRLTVPTRAALAERLDRAPSAPRVFDAHTFAVLQAVAARLVPLETLAEDPGDIDLAGRFDAQLADSPGPGWRRADLPPALDLHLLGLQTLDEAALATFAAPFVGLDSEQQDRLLLTVQQGGPFDITWPVRPDLWFVELLSALVEIAFAHPLVQVAIGYDGMADAKGWSGPPLVTAGSAPHG